MENNSADPGVILKIPSEAILSGIGDLAKASTSRVDDLSQGHHTSQDPVGSGLKSMG
jgi:hypothetical protein